jgi:hypothetical protein
MQGPVCVSGGGGGGQQDKARCLGVVMDLCKQGVSGGNVIARLNVSKGSPTGYRSHAGACVCLAGWGQQDKEGCLEVVMDLSERGMSGGRLPG